MPLAIAPPPPPLDAPEPSPLGLVVFVEVDDALAGRSGATVVVDGRAEALTFREFEPLAYLIENRRRALTRLELIGQVWPLGTRAGSRTVDVHIRRLRVKLGRHGRRIRTLRGHGCRLD
ncbi:winged helix-turn-helix domain-containing protein [Jiangella sp. DSM 45060]|uniref:winged helix-turn-helix domain-containing protein n=1 Tax=Jiangella sp. DSM 45060 TaxID=1798224 RepID=UPI0008792A06|nr:winged helix-turn-helix domain-containing protein [Jiangella sp. DSM 45060]SDT28299.1 Transcriptional regulatory protein, C terminal [Jiangella sp. DSM 45060]